MRLAMSVVSLTLAPGRGKLCELDILYAWKSVDRVDLGEYLGANGSDRGRVDLQGNTHWLAGSSNESPRHAGARSL